MHRAKKPQRPVDADSQHPQAAEQTSGDARPQACILGDQPNLRFGKSHVEIERCRQRGGHAGAEVVQKNESENEQCLMPAGPGDEFVKRLDHSLGERTRRVARARGLGDEQRVGDARQHEQRGNQEYGVPGNMVGEHQRECARNEARDAIGLNVDRRAETKLVIRQELSAVGVEHDVLARRKKSHRRRQAGNRPQIELGLEQAEQRNGDKQRDLGDQHPAPPAAEHRQRVTIEQRRPQEFPGKGQLHQCKQADRGQVDLLGAQPRRQQIDQQPKREAGAEAGEDADQHPPVEQRFRETLFFRAGHRPHCSAIRKPGHR